MDLVPLLEVLLEELQTSMQPSAEFDRRVHLLIGRDQTKPVEAYTSSMDAALLAVPPGWWWHLSHLESQVMPTSHWHDAPVSDAMDYHFNGRPLAYSCATYGSRDKIAISICIAALRARLGLLLKARALAEGRMYRVQTGDGPYIAGLDGKLLEMPQGSWINDDGKLIARREAFPQYAYLEPDPEPEDSDPEDPF